MVWFLDGLVPDQKVAKRCAVSDRWRVLVVDDDKALGHLLEVILEGEGYDFTFTTTGKYAVDLWCAKDYPPIILLDWNLPDIEGIEVCKQLRAHPQGKF